MRTRNGTSVLTAIKRNLQPIKVDNPYPKGSGSYDPVGVAAVKAARAARRYVARKAL